jgi:hypothetical protein
MSVRSYQGNLSPEDEMKYGSRNASCFSSFENLYEVVELTNTTNQEKRMRNK